MMVDMVVTARGSVGWGVCSRQKEAPVKLFGDIVRVIA